MIFTVLTAACVLTWFAAAAVLLAATRLMARHGLPQARRHRAALVARFGFTLLLLAAGGLAMLGASRHGTALAASLGLGSWIVTAVLLALALCMLLAAATLLFPELPGRRFLRRLENTGFWALVPLLALAFVAGVRAGQPTAPSGFAAAGALALVIAFTMAARPFLRGATVLVSRLGDQGSHPGTEATLKRLLRRARPFIIAAAIALGTMGALL